jgi:hypothetical protein
MIVYGIPADIINDHLTMSESQSIKCVKRFAVAIVEAFGLVFFESSSMLKTRLSCWRRMQHVGSRYA